MATEKSSNTLAQIGPIAAPAAGVLLAIVFIATAFATSSVSQGSDDLAAQISKTRKVIDDPSPGGTEPIPLADPVIATYAREGTNNWAPGDGSKTLLAVPIKWEVLLEEPKGDLFAQMDENVDGEIDSIEWARNPPPSGEPDFKKWDRNSDGRVTREEWNDPPVNDADKFRELDKNNDQALKAKDGEITEAEELAWDSYPFEGGIDLQEYLDRYKPKQERALGPVGNVEASVDPATMEILVKWEDPKIEDKPEDIAFMILRYAPQTAAKRQKEYARKIGEYEKKLREWESAFEKWWSGANADDAAKTNKDVWPNKNAAQVQFGRTTPKPIQPQSPSDWELVTEQPVTGNEYRDKTFDTDVTYTYAVYMGTQKNPKRGQNVRKGTEADYPGWFFYAEDQQAAGHPVLVRNRIEMSWTGIGDTFSITLTKWYRDEATGTWYRMHIVEAMQDGGILGGEYRAAQLKERKVGLKDLAGTDVNPDVVLPKDNTTYDFTTGFTFVNSTAKGFLLTSRTYGDFLLPKATKSPPAVPQESASSTDTLEVRCLTVKDDGKEGTFEITRWHKAGDKWLRVVMVTSAKKGAGVGGAVDLSKPAANVEIWDAGGTKLSGQDLKDFKDSVDLNAGTFDGLSERTVTVGGEAFDLFGTLHKE